MATAEEALDQLKTDFQKVRDEVGKILVGQDEVVE